MASDLAWRRAEFRRVAAQLDRLRLDCSAAFKAAYPVGSAARWMRGGRLRSGVVMRHGYGDRILVKNSATAANYWIYAYLVRQAEPPGEA